MRDTCSVRRSRKLRLLLSLGTVALLGTTGCVNDLKIDPGEKLCEGRLRLTGTFTQGAPQPADVVGCWPVGTWEVQPVIEDHSCSPEPQIQANYVFRVSRMEQEDEGSVESYEYVNAPDYEKIKMKVTSGGGGLCEGGFQIYNEEGTEVVNLKPSLYADLHIDGFGDFTRFSDSRWDPPEQE